MSTCGLVKIMQVTFNQGTRNIKMTKEEFANMTKEEFEAVPREEFINLIRDCLTDCISLCKEGSTGECMDKLAAIQSIITVWSKVNVSDDLYKLTCDMTDKNDTRIQKLNSLTKFIETAAWYTDGTGFGTSTDLENYVDHIAEVEMLDEMDRCYIFTNIARNCSVACGAGQIIARGLFKNISW